MGLILPALLAAICFTSVAHGSEFDGEEDELVYAQIREDDGPPPALVITIIVIIIVVVVVIKAAIIACCCLCCPASPIYRWCYGDRSTNVTLIQPNPIVYPGNTGQNNFSFNVPPQPATVQDPPPQYNRNGYSKFDNPSDLESGHGQ